MAVQAQSTIESAMRKAGIAKTDPMRCSRIASAIGQTREFFGEDQVAVLRGHVAQSRTGPEAEAELERLLLSGDWVEVYREAREQRIAAGTDPNEKSSGSHLRNCTERNPFGWQRPESMRFLDHDRPGDWNQFRQAFNATVDERRHFGLRDHRVRGCTRFEVLGRSGHPEFVWSAEAHAAAMGRETAPAMAGEREVYGS